MTKKYNEYYIKGDVVYIKLPNCDEYATVNLDKWNELFWMKELRWYKKSDGYIHAYIPLKYRELFNNQTMIYLHKCICPCEDGYEVDHLDRNKLNNLTNNLVQKTHYENIQNKNHLNYKTPTHNTSGVKGVSFDNRVNKWRAYITIQRKQKFLGYFDDINDAINARQKAEQKFFGEFRYNVTNKQNNIKEAENE